METITRNMPVLALRGLTAFPGQTMSFDAERDISIFAKDLGISTTSAYKLIHKWNAELEAKNYTTISGKVSRRYYYERIYGMNAPADNGEAM